MTLGPRSRARAYALQVLYAADINDRANPRGSAESYADLFQIELDREAHVFASELVAAASEHEREIDELIQGASKNWRIERMNRVDLAILRLATCELCYSPTVPAKVILNEAVELAKRYGASESPAFVNGVLDRIAQQVRKE